VRIIRQGAAAADETALLAQVASVGEPGEIVVSGRHVLRQYIDHPQATRETKIPRANGLVWHRTGDWGLIDTAGQIWLTGRDKDLIRLAGRKQGAYPCEKQLDALPGIARSALLMVDGRLSLVVQCSSADWQRLAPDAAAVLGAETFAQCNVYLIERMPLDGRHNSKVDRPALRQRIQSGLWLPESGPDVVHFAAHIEREQKRLFWRSPARLARVGALLAIALILLGSQSSLSAALLMLLAVFYVQIPVVIGGVLHMAVVANDAWPALKVPLNRDWFGANKTWRGMLVVPALTALGAVALAPVEWGLAAWGQSSVLSGHALIWVGLVGGLGYVLGELPNSWIKRRMGIAPGTLPPRYEPLFVALDQIDSGLGVALLYGWVLGLDPVLCVLYAITFPFVALKVKYYLHRFRLKAVAR
jgi:CDP-diacylglycerol--serine O-phosphatidyltransferase